MLTKNTKMNNYMNALVRKSCNLHGFLLSYSFLMVNYIEGHGSTGRHISLSLRPASSTKLIYRIAREVIQRNPVSKTDKGKL